MTIPTQSPIKALHEAKSILRTLLFLAFITLGACVCSLNPVTPNGIQSEELVKELVEETQKALDQIEAYLQFKEVNLKASQIDLTLKTLVTKSSEGRAEAVILGGVCSASNKQSDSIHFVLKPQQAEVDSLLSQKSKGINLTNKKTITDALPINERLARIATSAIDGVIADQTNLKPSKLEVLFGFETGISDGGNLKVEFLPINIGFLKKSSKVSTHELKLTFKSKTTSPLCKYKICTNNDCSTYQCVKEGS
jgi:hypothetical protein